MCEPQCMWYKVREYKSALMSTEININPINVMKYMLVWTRFTFIVNGFKEKAIYFSKDNVFSLGICINIKGFKYHFAVE